MRLRSFLLFICGLLVHAVHAQPPVSPDEFLGYKVGSRFTPHYQVVSYFKYAAGKAANVMKLEEYGKTNEGRPLLLAFVSSEENLKNLDGIRKNNLRLANLSNDKMAATESTPVVVWLSYNVHGNEPSSSEAALQTLYALIDPSNEKTKQWLKNTVVIIDPCMNPDGRDRYISWQNAVVGKSFNPDPNAREHKEPWPGGRTNHYYFDLNRDWAWQTQLESQERMKVYNAWMPQVHVDFHEQGVNAPYYFAPAAQPFHEVVTPWQREFQLIIGKNHAKYFDAKGWLFFTKEVFDLYYPSYGDTYPMYNGAIGMTYEQGGGPAGGLGIITETGDTLTLSDRVAHHFATSLSTIEMASLHAAELVKEFHRFFNNAITAPVGEYKSYVVKTAAGGEQKMKALEQLLDNNGIRFGKGTGSFQGFNYGTGKQQGFKVGEGDLVINSAQPKSSLIKVLFEPRPLLVDSNTYDITAWSLPYLYGLDAFAVKQDIKPSGAVITESFRKNTADGSYGYVIKWQGWKSARVLSQLLKHKVKVRFSEQPFESNGQRFERGSLIVIKTSNQSFGSAIWDTVANICNANEIRMYPVASGFVDKGYDFGSNKIHYIKPPRVALLTSDNSNSNAVGQVWYFFEQELDYPITLIHTGSTLSVDLDNTDIIILPDGNYAFFNDRQAMQQLRDWVIAGGKLIAMEGALAQLARLDWNMKLKTDDDTVKNQNSDPYQLLRNYEDRERQAIKNFNPGSIFKVELDTSNPLAFGYSKYYYSLKQDDNIYEYLKDDGWNVGILKKENQVAGFVGSKLKQRLKDGMIFGVLPMGKGNTVMLADNPLFRDFLENGKLLFCNAVFMVGQ